MLFLSSRAKTLGFICIGSFGCRSPATETLSVYAASSLTEVFKAGEHAFEQRYPQIDVQLQFAGSQILKLQIAEGAPADVFASANPSHIQDLVDTEQFVTPTRFGTNHMVLIVPKGNPNNWQSLQDLATAQQWVIGSESVPAGAYAREVLQRAEADFGAKWRTAVDARIGSYEPNVRWVRTKVALGEADAGFVYASDVTPSVNVSILPLSPTHRVQTDLVMGLASPGDSPAPRDWQGFWLSDVGQDLLVHHGFQRVAP